MKQALLTLGSRGSPLALAQTKMTRKLLAQHLGLSATKAETQLPIKTFTTSGDQLQDRALVEAGGKGLFTKELEQALADGQIDLAVHSMKDVPTQMPNGLALAGMLPREDPREALIAKTAKNLADLPEQPVIGTASVRRQAQVLKIRPDAKIVLLRGNVGTRLKRLSEGKFDATFLAFAGLKRLEMEHVASGIIDTAQMLPSPAQGAVGLQCRENDTQTTQLVQPICCADTLIELAAERSFLAALDGSCRTPIAALARISGDKLAFTGEVYRPDGVKFWQRTGILSFTDAETRTEQARKFGHDAGASIVLEAGNEVRFDL